MGKEITIESEELLIRSMRALEQVSVAGMDNHVHMANSMDAIREVLKQINTPPEEGEKNKEE